MERKDRIFKSFSTALIAIMMFTAMMPSWAYGETAGSGAAVQTAEQQAAQSTASAPVIKNDISEQKASYAVGDTAKALTVTASSDDGGELSYQWQKSADNEEFADIDDADGAEYVPPTDKAGLSYYRVIVTSVVGKGTASEVSAAATSSAAAVTVKDSTAVKSPARSAESAVPEGDGTKTAPYRLATADDLMWFAEQVNKTAKKSTSALCAVLTADIDLTGRDWTPIGAATNTYSDYVAYGGVFDGNGKTISGLSIDNTKKYQAFIGYAKGAEVKDLTVTGSIKTSADYAAGIVAYGNPVTITDCTNAVTVSSAKYAAGIAASIGTSTGTVISGCRNTAPVSAAGDYLGGIVAIATGKTEIKSCFNSAAVKNSGKPGGYSYCTGGIAGSAASNSVISMCGNTGEIASTIKSTGGIAGRISGTIEKCFNTGDVTGIYETGGILGASSGATTTVESCYNTGNIGGTAPTATFNDTNAKGIGGIIGGVSSNSSKAAVLDCYNAGTVTDSTGVSGVTAGGVIGMSIGKNYSGVETKGLVSADNTYYRSDAASQGDGYSSDTEGITAKTHEEMIAPGFAAELGDSYIVQDNAYPALGWQDPNAKYAVKFNITPEEASLVVKDAGGSDVEPSDGTRTFSLRNGTYSYEITCDECESVSSSFTVAYGGQTISVDLKVKKYDYVFKTVPEDATLTVKGQKPLADGRTYQLAKNGNPYEYQAEKFGYVAKSGSFSVKGDAAADRKTITLKEETKYKVKIPFTKEKGGQDSETKITVMSVEYPDAVIKAEDDGSFSLPNGSYSYKITSPGYKPASGEFSVYYSDLTLDEAYLKIQTSWDGSTLSEPAKDGSGAYLIYTADELMWFDSKAALSSSAKLMADIRINDSVDAAPGSTVYKWSPVGTASSKAYTGTFDGSGHTISGLYVNNGSTSNTGMFGYVGKTGQIKDLTIADSIFISTANYAGAIAGDLAGKMEGCHAAANVKVTGKSYVGGIVGELDTGGSVSGCSNEASVTATSSYAGGIAGRIYSASGSALTDSYNKGDVTCTSYAGGITGVIYNGGTAQSVYSTGSIKATASSGIAGGITGQLRYGSIKYAYAAGSLEGTVAGGVAGNMDFARGSKTLDNVYYLESLADDWIGAVNGCSVSGTAVAKSASDIMQLSCGSEDSDLGTCFSADKDGINGGYPVLNWQTDAPSTDPGEPTPSVDGWDGNTSVEAPAQKDGIYQLATAGDLKWFAEKIAEVRAIKGVLTKDIDLNNRAWTPAGGSDADTAFAGSLDGAGHSITGFYAKGSGAGLFAYNAGTVKNLEISGTVRNADNAAAVAGINAGTVSGVTSNVTVKGGNSVAGIVAVNEGGTIKDCTNNGTVSGGQYIAGITAVNRGTVSGSVNTAMITASGTFAAGIAADNTSDSKNSGKISRCANSGHVISTVKNQTVFTGGITGRNDSQMTSVYNTGNVVSRGSGVGGCVGINTTGSTAKGLYSTGDVTGAYVDTESGEEFRVGGAVGEMVSGVSEAYYLDLLDIADSGSNGGTAVPLATLLTKAGNLTEMTPAKSAADGTVSLPSDISVGDTLKVTFKDSSVKDPVCVWYRDWSGEQEVMAVSDTYTVPSDMAGSKIYVKCMDPALSGIVKCGSESIQGFTGTAKISGNAVVGHTLTAEYSGKAGSTDLKYQWYRGNKTIESATGKTYTVTEDDLGKTISIAISSSRMPGEIKASAGTVKTGDVAGIWPAKECKEPALTAGIYMISNEAELKWFVNKVNGGATSADARLTADIALKSEKWYPIGCDKAYTGTFDGKGRTVSSLAIVSKNDDQGFFGEVGGKGIVKDLNVSGSVNAGGTSCNTGGIAGNVKGKITGCTFSGTVTGVSDVGGIAGQLGLNAQISQCRSSAAVTGNERIGGITGSVSYGTVSQCVNTGAVGTSGTTSYAGGIAGVMTNYAVIEGSYNRGSVSGTSYKGGIAGEATVCAAPQGCYSTGTVEAGLYSYGVLGSISGTEYISQTTGSYYLAENESAATDKTATGASAESMKKAKFVDYLNSQAGSKYFTEDTKNANDGFPVLQWEISGTSGGSTGGEDKPAEADEIKVTITIIGDTVHGADGEHKEYYDWLGRKQYTMELGSTALDLFKKAAADAGIEYEMSGNSYVSSLYFPDDRINLGEFSNGPRSGWMYTINGKFTDYMSAVTLKDGDDMRFFYVDDYNDVDWSGSKTAAEVAAEAEALINALPDPDKLTLADSAAVDKADSAYSSLSEEAKQLVSAAAKAKLYASTVKIEELKKAVRASLDEMYRMTGNSILKKTEKYSLDVGTSHGEWAALGLARAGIMRDSTAEDYAQNVFKYVKKKSSAKLHASKSTDNSRVILALTSIGRDVTDVAGYDLLEPLADFDYVKAQGINGPIWALIALDSHKYEITEVPKGTSQTTRELLINSILDAQLAGGGWAIDEKSAEVDITAMAIQALAPYCKSDEKVNDAVNKALAKLSDMQGADGKFRAYGTANAESNAQVIVALTSLGIDPAEDARFIKNGSSVLDALASFYSDGTFRHTLTSEELDNGIATEQAYYALASYHRMLEGRTTLFDMSDVESFAKIEGKADENTDGNGQNSSGSKTGTKQASGSTKSIKSKLTDADKVMRMIDAIISPEDSADALSADISKLTDDQLKSIIDAYKAYESLSDDDKLLVKNYSDFKKLLDRIGTEMHRDGKSGIIVEGIDWHYRLIVEKKDFDKSTAADIGRKLNDDSELLVSYDIYFRDLVTGDRYEPEKPVTVKMPKPDMKDFDSAVIVHVDDEGGISFIKCTEKDGYLVFTAQEFSMYAVAGVTGVWGDLLPVASATMDHMIWIIIAAAAAAALAAVIIARRRTKKQV